MRITGYESEWIILKELGNRIKQHRIALNITQAELANRCGISMSTEVRIENGEDSKISNLIKIMAVLGLTENIDTLIPEEQQDYKAIYEGTTPRKRVRRSNKQSNVTWIWEEDK